VARQKELLTLSAISQETGISQATLAKYAAEYDDIPSEGEGRSRRYPRSAVKMFQRLRKESTPGRRAGGSSPSPAKSPAVSPAKAAPVGRPVAAGRQAPAFVAPSLSIPSSIRLEPSTLSLEPLRLADEDRELLRGLVVALGGVEGQLRALTMSVGAIETELASMGNRTAPNPPAPRHGGGPPPKHSGAKHFQRPRARHSQHSNTQQPNTPRPFVDGHEGGNG
jgi:hypothetical protein